MKTLVNKIISNLGYILIICGMLIAEKVSTHATWGNIIKDNFGRIIFILIVIVVSELIIKYIKENK
jgi:predicted permease